MELRNVVLKILHGGHQGDPALWARVDGSQLRRARANAPPLDSATSAAIFPLALTAPISNAGAMARTRKTFLEKLADDHGFPKVQPLSGGMLKRHGPGTILIPAARQVDALMAKVPKGKLLTINQIRAALAIECDADMTCPIVAGIHARIAAGAAGELLEAGRKRVTPFWRTLKKGGELNEKYPGGLEGQAERLGAEGHTIIAKGKRLVVLDFERALVDLT